MFPKKKKFFLGEQISKISYKKYINAVKHLIIILYDRIQGQKVIDS